MIDGTCDVEITDVYPNSPARKVVRTEDEMGLRASPETPESVIARTRKENELGVGFLPALILQEGNMPDGATPVRLLKSWPVARRALQAYFLFIPAIAMLRLFLWRE